MGKKPKISQTISQQLLTMINTGQFPAGSRLPSEMDLAAHFSVSRATIREALSVLNALGILSSRQGGGNYVEEVDVSSLLTQMQVQATDLQQMRHLFEIRIILETEAAYLAALRRTESDLEQMHNALQILKYDFSTNDKSGDEADFSFHQQMVRAAHNPIMLHTMTHLSDLYRKVLAITLKQNIGLPRKRQQVYKEHEDIYLAIEAGQPELAKVQCRIHLQNVQKKLDLIL
ncbi:FadR/GntR family transcriptional regulator [Effusibacillus dendaii]|uniref:Pyruvate dehydrogenase complex repressor n=1 Tax=Effusibacillus dendaii TaxID=2743772 RepID=A0A7I8DCF6_9BACL|nr:FadR/GntR family transcriptional regulator [Effusibacillus dendaii]BCJ87707.1 GntR family transcriptional regulator [Effusibacillus dendaii]